MNARRLLRSAAPLLMSVAALVAIDADRRADADFFVNLYSGKEIVSQSRIPYRDDVTYTVSGQPWMDYEWLGRVITYLLLEKLGAWSLVLLRLLLGSGLLLIVYFHARRYARSPAPYMMAVLFFICGAGSFFIFRTTLVTFIAVAALMALLDVAREGRPRVLWIVPPLMVLWVNLHGGFALGMFLLGLAASESLFVAGMKRLRGGRPDHASSPGEWVLMQAIPPGHACGCFLASFMLSGLNPFGFENWRAVLHTMSGTFTPKIAEWRPLYVYGWEYAHVYVLMAALVAVLLLGRRRVTLLDLMILLSLGAATIEHLRFAPLFTIASSVVLVRVLPEAGRRLGEALGRWIPAGTHLEELFAGLKGERIRALATACAAALFALFLWARAGPKDLLIRLDSWRTPVGAVKYLRENGIRGRIFNEYDWGGYVRWMLPDTLIFIDGRSDTVYTNQVIRDYGSFLLAWQMNWSRVLESYKVQTILIRPEHAVVNRLAHDPRWLRVYEDGYSVIFVRDGAENAEFIGRLRAGRAIIPRLAPEDYLLR